MEDYIKPILHKIQPYYDKLNSQYSKSYLSGSIWYVGDDLLYWWNNECNNIRYFEKNKQKVQIIIEILKIENNEFLNFQMIYETTFIL